MSYLIPEDNEALESLVKHLATQYEQGIEPCLDFDGEIVENPEYDLFLRTLKDRYPGSELFAVGRVSPSQADVIDEDAISHNPPMTSIDKADGTLDEKIARYKNWKSDIEKRLGRPSAVVQSYKHDGVACRIYYVNGKLVKAGLRPNRGAKGTNVTIPIQHVKGIPSELPLPLTLAMGGELECRYDDFAKVQIALEAAGEDLRKNTRNHTAGAMSAGRLDPKEVGKGHISFTGYNIVGFDDADKYYKTKQEMAIWVNKTLNIPFIRVEPHNFDDLATMESNVKSLQYEVDGVVIEVDDREDFEQLGHTGDDTTKEPRGALAWKFEEERAEAVVNHIEWNASRTGKVPPVAVFVKPVLLAGTMVQRATCSNLGWLRRMKIGEGSTVKVYKAGKIIPKIECVIANEVSDTDHPTECPTCKTTLVVETNTVKVKGETINNQDLICRNPECAAKHVEGIAFYLKTMEAKGLGVSKVERVVATGKVKQLPDIYDLTVKDLIDADFSAREAMLAIATIHHVKPSKDDTKLSMAILTAKGEKKKVQGWQFFAALGISGAGKTIGKILFDHYKTMPAILTATHNELVQIPGIGDTTAQSIVWHLNRYGVMIGKLLEHVEPEGPKVGGKLEGLTFCLSGSFTEGKLALEKAIGEQGGKCASSVSKRTNYVVVGTDAGIKAKKADEYGITKLTPEELKKML